MDWVVLAAAVVFLGAAALATVGDSLTDFAGKTHECISADGALNANERNAACQKALSAEN